MLGKILVKNKQETVEPTFSVTNIKKNLPFSGCIDQVTATFIKGWCVNLINSDLVPELELFVGEEVITEFRPTLWRPDISKEISRSVLSGFKLHISAEVASRILELVKVRSSKRMQKNHLSICFQIRIKGYAISLVPIPGIELELNRNDLELLAKGQYFNSLDPFYVRFERMKAAKKSTASITSNQSEVKLVAFYLPQFHPFPENNEWWGEGFTEWTNVPKAQPQFHSHYQPHLPADLGFYDLRVADVREKQAELAREYGVYGFCYHHYWFAGRTLLEFPIRAMLESGKPDFPFCICWANEPWSRRWDGSENELLLAQPHDIDTDERFIVDIMPFLKDPRYIRVDDAPLIVIYRVGLLPDPMELFRRWRLIAAEHGVPDLHIVMAETFGEKDPYRCGCDAAVEFPPHSLAVPEISNKVVQPEDAEFDGAIFDYRDVVSSELSKNMADYVLYRGIIPSWDNTARRGKNAHIFHNASPEYYEIWLRNLVAYTKESLPLGKRFIFVNAWNEWAEGAHLEPDRKHGRQYLQATRQALSGYCTADSVLLEMKRSSKIDKTFVERAVKTLRSELDGLRRSNTYMAKQYDAIRNHGNIKRSIWINKLKADFSTIDWDLDELCFNIDRINQYGLPNLPDEVVLHQHEIIDLAGWLFVHHWQGGANQLYLTLDDDNGRQAISLIRNRFDRPDVSSAFSGQVQMPAGFEMSVPLNALEPTSYAISLIITDGKTWRGGHSPLRLHLV